MKSVVMGLPKLREITLDSFSHYTGPEFTHDLPMLRHLRTINIRFISPINLNKPMEWLRWAKGILSRVAQKSEDKQEPRKVVLYFDGMSETHFVNLPEEP